MTPSFVGHDYYKKMLELQEQLRKSEENRIRLEERFSLMEQESRMRHEACINKLRMRYIEFLEEQRLRDERNHKLLGALDKVDTNLALMSAKTDKLHTLKREYEASILRAHGNQRYTNSIAGDSGVMSQNEDKLIRREIRSTPQITSAPLIGYSGTVKTTGSLRESFENYYNPASTPRKTLSQVSSSSLLSKPLPVRSEPFLRDKLLSSGDYQRNLEFKFTTRTPPSHTWNNNHTTVDLDNLYKRDLRKNLISKESSAFRYLDSLKTPQTLKLTDLLSSMPNYKETLAGNVVENELERYINKIRNLHDNHDHSLEEVDHEQNTSGDLLNVTLSDDGFDHLPVEERKDKVISQETEHVLALASKITDKHHTESYLNHPPLSKLQENDVQESSVIRPINYSTSVQPTLLDPKIKSVALPEESELTKAKIDDDITQQAIKLEESVENTNALEQSKSIEDFKIGEEFKKEESLSEKDEFSQMSDKLNTSTVISLADPEEVSKDFQVTSELQPWNVENLEKQVKKVFIDDASNLNNCTNTENQIVNSSLSTHDSAKNNEDEQIKVESKEVPLEINQETALVTSEVENDIKELQNVDENNIKNNQVKEVHEHNEVVSENVDQGYEYDQQQYQVESNQEYQYEEQEQYKDNNEEQYQYEQYGEYGNDSNSQYHDPNFQYDQDQQYINNENQQYSENQQFIDPNQQYAQDSNQEYTVDPNQEYAVDSNQEYAVDPNQLYIKDNNQEYAVDPNQLYTEDNNQQYTEDPHQQYQEYPQDPNQTIQQEAYIQDSNQVYDSSNYNYSNQDQGYLDNNAYEEGQFYASEENQEQKNYPEGNEKVEDNQAEELNGKQSDNENDKNQSAIDFSDKENTYISDNNSKKQKDEIQVMKESDTDSTIEINASNTESEFDFN